MNKIRKKTGIIVVLAIILLASLVPLRKLYYTQKITDKFYQEYYFARLKDYTEEELERHFNRIDDNTIRITSNDLKALDESFVPLLEKIQKEDAELIIKVSKPYLNKKVHGKFENK